MKPQRSGRFGVVAVVLAIVVLVVVSTISREPTPFDLHSTSPDGFAAIRLLLAEHGIQARQVRSDSQRLDGAGAGSIVFVPAPDMASGDQLSGLLKSAERGATVIYGSPPRSSEDGATRWLDRQIENSELAEAEALLTPPDTCDMVELADLGRIDAFFSSPITQPLESSPGLPAETAADHGCYGTADTAHFFEVQTGSGRIIVLSSPYLWVNARLQPVKETGGRVLDNGVTALRLLSASPGELNSSTPEQVLFVKAVPTAKSVADGTRDPIDLLPGSFKALLVELAVAVLFYIWWRGTRLGRPVVEASEVSINSSELTAAVGRLFEEDPAYMRAGAAAMLQDARQSLAVAVGVPAAAEPAALSRTIAQRCGRNADEVHELLFGNRNFDSADALVQLENQIEQLRTEVLDVRSG